MFVATPLKTIFTIVKSKRNALAEINLLGQGDVLKLYASPDVSAGARHDPLAVEATDSVQSKPFR